VTVVGADIVRDRASERRRVNWQQMVARVVVLVAVVVIMEAWARHADSPFFPPPSEIWKWARVHWFSGPARRLFITDELQEILTPSLRRLAIAYVFGVTASVLLGSLICAFPHFRSFVYPLLQFLRSIPTAAALPMVIVIVGIGEAAKIWIIASGIGLALVVSVVDGISSVDTVLLDTGKIYRLGGWTRQWSIMLPGALPRIFAGLRISTSVALVSLVLAEVTGSTNGIGFAIMVSQRNFLLLQMWAAILLLGVLGLMMNIALTSIERRMLSWHQSQRTS
jgi:ABC-type nitrate/sulfonate/bicarbonate transport system permease component